jgi:two-component system, cell cycle response regulator DivK
VFQAEPARTREDGGTGLGLSICRRLATALEGRIPLESKLREGFTDHPFRGQAPMTNEKAQGDGGAHESAVGETGPLVLIVDDAQDNRTIYVLFLKLSGFRTAEAENGEEALQKATTLLPDVVVMDLSLPVMDGWEATRRLKRDARTKTIPIVVLTGHPLPEHARAAREAGCDLVIRKPCLPDQLMDAIRRILDSPTRTRPKNEAEGPSRREAGPNAAP